MPRQARLDVAGALHHIMVRGINKCDIRGLDELGLSLAEIARNVGVSTSGIARAINR